MELSRRDFMKLAGASTGGALLYGALSPQDEVYVLEENDQGEPFLTWMVIFSGNPSYVPPEPGDEFLLATLKPFTHRDIFEFTTSPRENVGDVNGDNNVDVLDVIIIVRHILELEELTGSAFRRADCTNEGYCWPASD